MAGDDFLNACCLLGTDWPQSELQSWLKRLEDAHGRDRSQGSWTPRTLDLDLLLLDGHVLVADAFAYAHVALPAAELVDHVPEPAGGLIGTARRLSLNL